MREVHSVWWRRVQLGEFFNIERSPYLVSGGGGARYIEIPRSLVGPTQHFLGVVPRADGSPTEKTIVARVIGEPDVSGELQFLRKAGGRLRIANQNRQATPESRHPAWRSDRGFPRAPDSVKSSAEARPYYPDGGLRVYIVRTVDGEYYAGFTKGPAPAHLPDDSLTRKLYAGGPGGVFYAKDDTWLGT